MLVRRRHLVAATVGHGREITADRATACRLVVRRLVGYRTVVRRLIARRFVAVRLVIVQLFVVHRAPSPSGSEVGGDVPTRPSPSKLGRC
ncbi:MAG: hypothetical protein IRZ02_03355 [Acidothermus sp.]|nr:hypothetical protein [Acidothermus sp.]